jgi:hypothetical protein
MHDVPKVVGRRLQHGIIEVQLPLRSFRSLRSDCAAARQFHAGCSARSARSYLRSRLCPKSPAETIFQLAMFSTLPGPVLVLDALPQPDMDGPFAVSALPRTAASA